MPSSAPSARDGSSRQTRTPAATMRENLGPPRGGRDALVAHETAVLAGHRSIVRHLPTVAPTRLDELTLQTWRDDKIVEEQFYYDPGQFAAPAA